MANDETGQVPQSPQDARLDSLEERLARAQAKEAERVGKVAKSEDDSERQGSRVLSLLLGGIFGGSLIGWLIGGWLGSGQVGLIVGLVIGVIGAFYSILKMAAPKR